MTLQASHAGSQTTFLEVIIVGKREGSRRNPVKLLVNDVVNEEILFQQTGKFKK
jgi:hypothetical protein